MFLNAYVLRYRTLYIAFIEVYYIIGVIAMENSENDIQILIILMMYMMLHVISYTQTQTRTYPNC